MNKYKFNHILKYNPLKLLQSSKYTLIALISIFAILLLYSGAMAATYYIDYASGNDYNNGTTKSAPWKRCPGMNGFSGSYSHSAGDKFIFKGGVTWPSTCFQLYISYGGSSGSIDQYTVDETWYSGTSYSAPVFDGENQFSINNFYLLRGADGVGYITINGIKIIDIGVSGSNYGGFYKGSLVNSVTFSNLEMIGYCGHGIVLNYGGAVSSGVKIRNCKLSHFTNHIEIGNSGEVTDYVDDVEISGCEFFDPHSQLVNGDHGDGIHIWNTYNHYMFRNLLIFNNKFYGDWGGADADTSNTAQIYLEDSCYSGKIYNNHHTFSNTTTVRENYMFSPGIYTLMASNTLEVYNNTICASKMATRPSGWADQSASFGVSHGIGVGGTAATTIKGNIVTDCKVGINMGSYGVGSTCDYNVVKVRSDGNYGKDISTWCATLAAWRSRGFGSSSIESDPFFYDITKAPLDLRLQSDSPAINLFPTSKAPTILYTFDINGSPRPQGEAWDAGAYEGSALEPRSPTNLKIY